MLRVWSSNQGSGNNQILITHYTKPRQIKTCFWFVGIRLPSTKSAPGTFLNIANFCFVGHFYLACSDMVLMWDRKCSLFPEHLISLPFGEFMIAPIHCTIHITECVWSMFTTNDSGLLAWMSMTARSRNQISWSWMHLRTNLKHKKGANTMVSLVHVCYYQKPVHVDLYVGCSIYNWYTCYIFF